MEKYKPISPFPAPYYPAPNVIYPAAAIPNPPLYPAPAPVNVHASYEQINIYPLKKPHYHYGFYGGWTSTGVILVLFILLVIILRCTHGF